MKKLNILIILLIFVFYTEIQSAKEILIYANSINYDSNKNLVAKGSVKIISKDEIITSELVIINEIDKTIILPKDFQYKDIENNYYYGSSGEFTTNFENATINDLKLLLNDGSRIVGKKAYKRGSLDLINKGVYSPCISRINIKNFLCPIWQIEGEKILHDREKLFIHQKHSKMRILNLPVFYLPYMVSPSPLRKERKSGFLNPSINFNFLDTKVSQQTSLPYYFAISQDKELLFTPTFNYGGGVDSSQILLFDYNQVISGGILNIDASIDTNLENQDNESWVKDATIITNYNQNLNQNYKLSISSAFQSSPTYLRKSNLINFLDRNNSLSTSLNLDGYDIIKKGDTVNYNISGYQVVKNNEDNKTTPIVFPYISYKSPQIIKNNTKYNNYYNFYNIFRDTVTDDHAQKQQRISHTLKTNSEFYNLNSKINFKTEFHSQIYNVENKKIDNINSSSEYYRFFPMTGVFMETPMINKKYNFNLIPKFSFILNSSQPNPNKISNEESTNNDFNLTTASELNRYTGNDKLDNSKRINYGINLSKDIVNFEILQSYEFQTNSIYHKEAGNKDYLSDTLGNFGINGNKNLLNYSFRFNNDQGKIKSQTANITNSSILGSTKIEYIQERKETNSIIVNGTETMNFYYTSATFMDFSNINFESHYDLINDNPTNYKLAYKYFDECFGVNLNFERSFYEDRDLKPQDILTIMFSFKHLGSYLSTNLAVSEEDKQEIKWINTKLNDELFN